MRWILLLVLGLAGCQGMWPWEQRCSPVFVDDPRISIAEQEKRGRARLALPDPSMDVGPRTFAEYPEYRGRISQ